MKQVIGSIGMYPNTDENGQQAIYVSLKKGDDGVPIEKLLPPGMRGDGFDNAPIPEYFQIADLWLSDFSQLKQMLNKGKANKDRGIAIDPPFNLTKLGLMLPDGSVDKERTIRLFQITAKCWKFPLQPGLICKIASLGWDLDMVEKIVLKIASSIDLNIPNIQHDVLYNMLIPPEARSGEIIMQKEEIEKTLRWYTKSDDSSSIESYLLNRAGFTELGILQNSVLNIDICQKAADYVWSHRDDESDFDKLKGYLSQFVEAESPVPVKKKIPKSALQKLKKRRRKQGRVRR